MLGVLLALTAQDPDAVRAESLLAARDFEPALAIARRLVERHPMDAQAFLLLGRIHFARPVIGRYPALDAFRAAAKLAPDDPEPLYRQAEVGSYLGSDEGDRIARDALLRLFELDPDYEESWRSFGRLFQNDATARRAERALARHGDNPAALERRAQLALHLGDGDRADSLLARVLTRRSPHVPAYLLRARLNFEASRDSVGLAWYESALVYADLDSAGVLWDAAWIIASPEETARFAATAPGDRTRFFEWFWAKRDPNLVTRANERIPEHFRRLAEARRRFRLLHPLATFHRSAPYRTLAARGAAEMLGAALFMPDGTDAGGTAFTRAGLDARGLLWVRHGPPDYQVPTLSPGDLESWHYQTTQGTLAVALARGTGGLAGGQFGGDFVFVPTSRRQGGAARRLLATDRTTVAAARQVRAWRATFMNPTNGLTDIYFKAHADTAAVALWDTAGEEIGRDVGPGLLDLSAPPGRYRVGLDADSAGSLGRLRADLVVRGFSPAAFGLSSLVLAPGDAAADRRTILDAMPVNLEYPTRSPLTCYAEVYGLSGDSEGGARYRVRYTFARLVSVPVRLFGGGDAVVFEFTRAVPAGPLVRERLRIDPGRVPPGRYRVTLAVTDLRQNVKSESVALEITLR